MSERGNSAAIFRCSRSRAMDEFSVAAALPSDDAIEIAWPLDEIVASFMPRASCLMPHAEDH